MTPPLHIILRSPGSSCGRGVGRENGHIQSGKWSSTRWRTAAAAAGSLAGPMPRPGPPQLRESRSSRPRRRPSWHADRPLPAAALDAALLDYNIFNCCLLRDVLAAAAQGCGSVLALLVCVSLSVTLGALPKSCACTWLRSGEVAFSSPVTFCRRC